MNAKVLHPARTTNAGEDEGRYEIFMRFAACSLRPPFPEGGFVSGKMRWLILPQCALRTPDVTPPSLCSLLPFLMRCIE